MKVVTTIKLSIVSIHAPREGCDYTFLGAKQAYNEFQFTHPGRGATVGTQQGKDINYVSIHAPREGCDSVVQSSVLWGG